MSACNANLIRDKEIDRPLAVKWQFVVSTNGKSHDSAAALGRRRQRRRASSDGAML